MQRIILIIVAVGVIGLIGKAISGDDKEPAKKEKSTTAAFKGKSTKERIDSLAAVMLKDDQGLGIKKVSYDPKDSTLKIACEVDRRDRKKLGTTSVFDQDYNTYNLPINFTKVYFYESSNDHFGKLFSFTSNKFSRQAEAFKSRFCSTGFCEPLANYLRNRMNDPGSFDPEECNVYYNNSMDGTIIVEQSFRGKNAFGALVLKKTNATMDMNGNVLKANIE